jgi:phosphatidylserine decarboxylase
VVLYVGAAVLLGLVLNFFRLPKRAVGASGPGDVLCPSDGKVVVIEEVEETEYFQDRRIQVSIFMSPLNVHAQWAPVAGKVLEARYHPGKYLVAWHPKSSTENERTTHVIEGPHGPVLFRQIAGAVARRICWYMKPGQQVAQGEEVGFIKFGSRIDVFLPLDADIQVKLDERVTGRETLLARLPKP